MGWCRSSFSQWQAGARPRCSVSVGAEWVWPACPAATGDRGVRNGKWRRLSWGWNAGIPLDHGPSRFSTPASSYPWCFLCGFLWRKPLPDRTTIGLQATAGITSDPKLRQCERKVATTGHSRRLNKRMLPLIKLKPILDKAECGLNTGVPVR